MTATREKPKLVYFPLPMLAWLDVVSDLTISERVALENLVFCYAIKGSLPGDDRALASIARVSLRTWLKMKPRLQLKFPEENWRWLEIDQAIERRKNIGDKRSFNGQLFGKPNLLRWHARRTRDN
jgi:uncharacterized protein YdaU (DUF1376 family)